MVHVLRQLYINTIIAICSYELDIIPSYFGVRIVGLVT